MLPKEYRTITDLSGPLIVVEKTIDVRYDELVEISLSNGKKDGAAFWRYRRIGHWCRFLKEQRD